MSALNDTLRVGLYDEFLDAFATIPRTQQKKVNKFIRRFRQDPTGPGINYEKIRNVADDNLRSVRIDKAWRAIVLKPETGNVYVLLWVDHHDKAYRWAEDKHFSIHPDTGALQVLAASEVEATPESAPEEPALYDRVRDRELRRLGVPEPLLATVRQVRSLAELEALNPRLPAEAFEALWFLGDGESLEEVERAMAVSPPAEPVDTEDFARALEQTDSQRRFVLVDDDETLEAMLDAPLEKWRVFLHPMQRKLVDRSWSGPVRVLGGAGTGKTVVALHRAAWLLRERFTHPDDRLLFTTFTRNLAADIRAQLDKLCPPADRRRIEVVPIDRWASDLLGRAGYGYTIRYWPASSKLRKLWSRALQLQSDDLDLSDAFYRQEWDQVVQPQGCTRWRDYMRADRRGRGRGLTRRQRKAAWPVFDEYRNLLESHKLREPEGALRDARALLEDGSQRVAYRAILVDEAQDMTTTAFELLRAAVPEGPDDLFIVGDGHQRIYRRKVVLSHAGVHIVGRSHRLRINYRTTDEIRRFAVGLLEGVRIDDLDGGHDSSRGYRSLMHGALPEVRRFEAFEEEADAIVAWIRDGGSAHEVCLAARTNKLRDRYKQALEDRGLETYAIRRSEAEDSAAPGVRVATMHRVKGLEFNRVVLAGVDHRTVPLRWALNQADDEASRDDLETMERALVYVAATRARRALLVTGCGEWSPVFASSIG